MHATSTPHGSLSTVDSGVWSRDVMDVVEAYAATPTDDDALQTLLNECVREGKPSKPYRVRDIKNTPGGLRLCHISNSENYTQFLANLYDIVVACICASNASMQCTANASAAWDTVAREHNMTYKRASQLEAEHWDDVCGVYG